MGGGGEGGSMGAARVVAARAEVDMVAAMEGSRVVARAAAARAAAARG